MTEYDYSPEAYERFMATQTRISNWIDNVSQSMQTPSPSSRQSYDQHHHHQPPPPPQQQHPYQPQYQRHSRPPYPPQQYPQQQQHPEQHTHSNSHSQTHSRSNSLSRSRSHSRHPHYQEPPRPRSYSQTGGARHSAPPPPMHSRTYSYAMNQPPLPGPIPVPQPVPYPQLAPRRSRTLPPQSQNVVYHTYEAPRGGPTYVIVPPVGPHGHQLRQSPMAQTKRPQPLLKRLFTSFGPWGSSSGASPKGKFPPARRYPRRSSF